MSVSDRQFLTGFMIGLILLCVCVIVGHSDLLKSQKGVGKDRLL